MDTNGPAGGEGSAACHGMSWDVMFRHAGRRDPPAICHGMSCSAYRGRICCGRFGHRIVPVSLPGATDLRRASPAASAGGSGPSPNPRIVVRGRPLPGGEGFSAATSVLSPDARGRFREDASPRPRFRVPACRSSIPFRSSSPSPALPAAGPLFARNRGRARARVGAGAVRAPDCPRPRVGPSAGRTSPVRRVGGFFRAGANRGGKAAPRGCRFPPSPPF